MLTSDHHSAGRMSAASVTLDALIPENHIIRKIDAAVRWEERCAPMRACYSAERGRPAFEPDVLLAIALLQHIYRVPSLRTIAAEIQTNLVYRWFVGCPLDENAPHFSTISANLLHRIPKDVFENAFADALCDIIEAGVMKPVELIFPSPFLTKEGQLDTLSLRYFILSDQLSFSADDGDEEEDGNGQLTIF